MSEKFSQELLKLGLENLRFFVRLRKGGFLVDSREETWQECYISEHKYKVKDNYKLTLVPIDQKYCSEDFYISDFKSALKSGYIVLKQNFNDHAEDITWYEPMGSVMLVHTANILVME